MAHVGPVATAAIALLYSSMAVAQPASEPSGDAPEVDAPETSSPTPGATQTPPDHYYTEPPEAPGEPQAAPTAPASDAAGPVGYEPPPPVGAYHPIYEPPPPPKPKHVAPKTALWAGARVGWFVPFGNVWTQCVAWDAWGCRSWQDTRWSDYTSNGAALELDLGARLGRRYNVFVAWEHAELGGGKEDPARLPSQPPEQTAAASATSDYYAIAVRFSSDPDSVGFLTEFALGFRRFTAEWEDGTELTLSDYPFEFRLGLGADIRLSPAFSLSPMLNLGFGSFADGEWRYPDGSTEGAFTTADERAGHGWLTLQLGAHFDLG